MYKGDLVIREIPYGKRRIKWSYDVIEDKQGRFKKDDIVISRVVLRHIIGGNSVELIDDNGNSLCLLLNSNSL